MDKAKIRLMKSIPPLLRRVLPEDVFYDESLGKFRNAQGQFISSTDAQKNVVTKQSAARLSEGLTELLFQFNRMLAYTSNMETIKDAEYEAIRDASREAEIEAVNAVPVQSDGIGIGDMLSNIGMALNNVAAATQGIIEKVIRAAVFGTAAWVILQGLLKSKDKSPEPPKAVKEASSAPAPSLERPPSNRLQLGKKTKEQETTPKVDESDTGMPTYAPVLTGGYGKATVTEKQLVGAPKLSSVSDLFTGGSETPVASRGAAAPSSKVGYRTDPLTGAPHTWHAGQDIRANRGTPVNAIAAGRVIRAGMASGYGNVVDILHGTLNGTPVVTRYAHLSSITTSLDAMVGRGTKIGAVGSVGRSTGNHLHFELIVGQAIVISPVQAQYILSHVLGDYPDDEEAPSWVDPKQTASMELPQGAIKPATAAVQLAAVDTGQLLIPPVDETGNTPLRVSDIRAAYSNMRTSSYQPSIVSPGKPMGPSAGSADPALRYRQVLGGIAV